MKTEKQQKHLLRLAQMKMGKPSPLKGRPRPKFSNEWKERISRSRQGFKVSQETKDKISEGHKGKKKSLEWRKQMSLRIRGEGNPMWKGGLSLLHYQIRDCFEYRQWRSDVFTRDNHTCQICGVRGETLNADHIRPLFLIIKEHYIRSLEDATNCSELWNIDNGRTLCVTCHRKTDTFGVKVLKLYA